MNETWDGRGMRGKLVPITQQKLRLIKLSYIYIATLAFLLLIAKCLLSLSIYSQGTALKHVLEVRKNCSCFIRYKLNVNFSRDYARAQPIMKNATIPVDTQCRTTIFGALVATRSCLLVHNHERNGACCTSQV